MRQQLLITCLSFILLKSTLKTKTESTEIPKDQKDKLHAILDEVKVPAETKDKIIEQVETAAAAAEEPKPEEKPEGEEAPAEGAEEKPAEAGAEEEVTADSLLKGIATSSVKTVFELQGKEMKEIGSNFKLVFTETTIKITNSDQDLPEDQTILMDIDLSKLYISCLMDGAPTICTGTEQAVFDKNQDDASKPLLEKFGKDNQVLENEWGKKVITLVFENAKQAMDFKLYTLQLQLKNINRVSKFKLDSPPNGQLIIDNNGSVIVLTQETDEGEKKTEIVPIKSILDYTRKPNSNDIEIHYSLEVEKDKTQEKTMMFIAKGEGQDPKVDTAGDRLYKALDSATNIYFYYWLTEHKKDMLIASQNKKAVLDAGERELPVVYKYPVKTMKILENEINKGTELSCIDRNKQITYIAEDFAMGNALIFDEIMFAQQVQVLFPSVGPSFQEVKFTSAIRFCDIDCFQDFFFKINPEDEKATNFHIDNEDSVNAVREMWAAAIEKSTCKGEKIPFSDFQEINLRPSEMSQLTDKKFAQCIKAEEKYVPGNTSLITPELEDAIRMEMVKHLIVTDVIVPLVADEDKKAQLQKMLDKQPATSFCLLSAFEKEEALKAQFAEITATSIPELAEQGDLTKLQEMIVPCDKFTLLGMPLGKLDRLSVIRDAIKSKEVEIITGNTDPTLYQDGIFEKLREKIGLGELFYNANSDKANVILLDNKLRNIGGLLMDLSKINVLKEDRIKLDEYDPESPGIADKLWKVMTEPIPANLLAAKGKSALAEVDKRLEAFDKAKAGVTEAAAAGAGGEGEKEEDASEAEKKQIEKKEACKAASKAKKEGEAAKDGAGKGKDGEGKDGKGKDGKGKDGEGKDGKGKDGEGKGKDGEGKGKDGEGKDGEDGEGKDGKGKDGEGKGKGEGEKPVVPASKDVPGPEETAASLAGDQAKLMEALGNLSPKQLREAIMKTLMEANLEDIYNKSACIVSAYNSEQADLIQKTASVEGDINGCVTLAEMKGLAEEIFEDMKNSIAGILEKMEKKGLVNSLSEAMKNPAFAAAFAAANPGLANMLKAGMSGNEEAGALGDMDKMLDDKMNDLLANPDLAAATLLALLDDMGPEQVQALIDCVNDGVAKAQEAKTSNENIDVNLSTTIMQSDLENKDKVKAALGMKKKPALLNKCVAEALMNMDPELLKAAMAALLACDEELAKGLADAEALKDLGLDAAKMKEGLMAALKSEVARGVCLDVLADMDKVNDANSAEWVESMDNSEDNAGNKCIAEVMKPVKEGDGAVPPRKADVQGMLACDPEAKVPENMLENFAKTFDEMTDEEIKECLDSCMNNPAFAEAFKMNATAIEESMKEMQEANKKPVKAGDLLKDDKLSDDEKKQILKNGCENPIVANAVGEIANDILADAAALEASIQACKDAIAATGDKGLADELNKLDEEFGADPSLLLKKIHGDPPLADALGDAVKKDAISKIDGLDHDQLGSLYDACANDPNLAKLLAEGSAELSDELSKSNVKNALFSSKPEFEMIDPESPCTQELISKIASLDKIADKNHQFKTKAELILNENKNVVELRGADGQEVVEAFDTIGKLIDKFGIDIFDLALDADQAKMKMDDLINQQKIKEDLDKLKQEGDLLENMEQDGAATDKIEGLKFEIGEVSAELMGALLGTFDQTIELASIKACKVHENLAFTLKDTLPEDESELKAMALEKMNIRGGSPSAWVVDQKVLTDIMLSLKVRNWFTIAKQKKIVNQIDQERQIHDLNNWYSNLNNEIYWLKAGIDNQQNLRYKVEQLIHTISPYTLCTEFQSFEGCAIDVRHETITALLSKQEFDEDLNMKNESPPTVQELRSFQSLVAFQEDWVDSKPNQVMRIKQGLDAAGGDVRMIPIELNELADEAGDQVSKVGMTNQALIKQSMTIWVSFVTEVAKGEQHEDPHIKLMLQSITNNFKLLQALPFVSEAITRLMGPKCQWANIPEEFSSNGRKQLSEKMKNLVNPSNFWFMRKLSLDMDKHKKLEMPSLKELRLALKCVKRFAHNEQVYKSNTTLDVIQMILKSPKLNRDQLRDIQAINFMSRADIFMEYMPEYLEQLRLKKNPPESSVEPETAPTDEEKPAEEEK